MPSSLALPVSVRLVHSDTNVVMDAREFIGRLDVIQDHLEVRVGTDENVEVGFVTGRRGVEECVMIELADQHVPKTVDGPPPAESDRSEQG
jgi:hypothetical protein